MDKAKSLTKRKRYAQIDIVMDVDESYDLLMEWAKEQGPQAVEYLAHKLNRMIDGIPNLGIKGAANLLLCAIGQGIWPVPAPREWVWACRACGAEYPESGEGLVEINAYYDTVFNTVKVCQCGGVVDLRHTQKAG